MFTLFTIERSALRAKLLRYFFSNPDATLYVREIAGLLGVDPTNLSRELERLGKAGLFSVTIRGNQLHYHLNKGYQFYSQLAEVVTKTIGIEAELGSIVRGSVGIRCAFIYGSFADGTAHGASDVDLFIIGSPDEDLLMKRIEECEQTIGREVNYNVYSPEEFKKRLAKKDSFVVNVHNRKKIMLKGDINGL